MEKGKKNKITNQNIWQVNLYIMIVNRSSNNKNSEMKFTGNRGTRFLKTNVT